MFLKRNLPSFTLFLCALVALWLKNTCNLCNPWLMNYLSAYKAHSTTVEDSLQISPLNYAKRTQFSG